jgi:DNA-binding transcriptional MocR family regulator
VATISFARGAPAPECLPGELLAEAAAAALGRDATTILSYGTAPGYQPLREWIGERHGVPASRVLLTNGSLQGFVFLAEHLVAQGKTRVLVESPTYDRPLLILRKLGAEIVPLALDDDGLDPAALERALDDGPEPAFLYTIPTFQNPSGLTLSTERRKRVAEIAAARNLLVLEDDPYGLIRFDGEPEPSLFSLDTAGVVAYSSSFSKTIAPGLRVGYFVLPEALESALEKAAGSTYISPALLSQATVYEFVSRGNFEPNIERSSGLLQARRDAMLRALDRSFPSEASWSRPDGGYFLWLDLPKGVSATSLLAAAEAEGVTFVKGTDFGGAENTARLAFSFASPDEIETGIERLAGLLPAAAAA